LKSELNHLFGKLVGDQAWVILGQHPFSQRALPSVPSPSIQTSTALVDLSGRTVQSPFAMPQWYLCGLLSFGVPNMGWPPKIAKLVYTWFVPPIPQYPGILVDISSIDLLSFVNMRSEPTYKRNTGAPPEIFSGNVSTVPIQQDGKLMRVMRVVP